MIIKKYGQAVLKRRLRSLRRNSAHELHEPWTFYDFLMCGFHAQNCLSIGLFLILFSNSPRLPQLFNAADIAVPNRPLG